MICHGIVNKQWIEDLNKEMFQAEHEKSLHYEGTDTRYLGQSFGRGSMPVADKLLQHLTPMICGAYGDVKPANSYSRIYYNGSILNPHVDREGLDVTLSLCTYTNIEVEWPLYVDYDGKTFDVCTPPGSAAIILGTKYNHYRKLLICGENQKVVQIFLHWSKK